MSSEQNIKENVHQIVLKAIEKTKEKSIKWEKIPKETIYICRVTNNSGILIRNDYNNNYNPYYSFAVISLPIFDKIAIWHDSILRGTETFQECKELYDIVVQNDSEMEETIEEILEALK